MPDHVLLLCSSEDARWLGGVLTMHNPALAVAAVSTRTALDAVAPTLPPDTRLIAFFTGVVVPAALLDRLSGPAYNLHPGPPAYPGKHPIAFALHDGAASYGATAHEMAARTDSGAIVGTAGFSVPPGADASWLKEHAHRAMLRLFLALAPLLAVPSRPLPRLAVEWGPRRCSQKALDALCSLPADIGRDAFERRLRALAGVDGAVPTLTLHGRRFALIPE